MPQEQHFVPQVYQQRFAYNKGGDLWGLKIRNLHEKETPKPKKYNKSEICKLPDLYRINDLTHLTGRTISDENHVENFGFPYESSDLTKVFDALERNKPFLKSNACQMLTIIFSIKRRNPRFIDLFIRYPGVDMESFINKELDSMKAELVSVGLGVLPIDFDKIKHDQMAKMKDDCYKSDIHKGVLLDAAVVPDEKGNEKLDHFLGYKFTLFRTTPNLPFITSDNPGFTLKHNREVFNLDLGFTQKLFFPISSMSALMIEFVLESGYLPQLLHKDIRRLNATLDIVDMINVGTACNSLEYIYAGDKQAVANTFQSWKSQNS